MKAWQTSGYGVGFTPYMSLCFSLKFRSLYGTFFLSSHHNDPFRKYSRSGSVFHNFSAFFSSIQKLLKMTCTFTLGSDIIHLLGSAEPDILICTTNLMLGEALSNKCFTMLRKEVPSWSLHNIALFEVRNYHNKLRPVSWGHLCTDYLFATVFTYA